MDGIKLTLNTRIVSGKYSLNEIVNDKGYKKIGVICDEQLFHNSDHARNIIVQLEEQHELFLKLYDYPFEPSYQYLDSLMEKIRENNLDQTLDVWVGIGGGSTMDTAKGLSILCKNDGPSIQYKGFPKDLNKPLPVIAIPSTTGSGSEVVFNASFIDEDTQMKMGINDVNNYPVVSIIDPRLVSTAPRSVLASSGCDALVHTLESFVSKSSNHVTRVFSTKAFHLIMKNMSLLLDGKGNIKNWSNMQWAAVFAMWGLSNTSSGPTGALSYHLGTHFQVPHGTAGGVFIGKVSKHNHESGFHDYADLYGWDTSHDQSLSREEKSQLVIEAIEFLLDKAEIPKTLYECGVRRTEKDSFLDFVEQVKEAFDFNPVGFNQDDIENLLI